MAARLTQSGKTPISERISIFEQKTPTTTSATPSPGRVQISITKKTVTTSRNFSAIKSQFNVTPSGEKNAGGSVRSASPVTPSPPSSLRSSAMSLNTSNPQISTPFKETPVPAARSTSVIKQPLVTQRSGSPTNKAQRTLSGQSKTSTTSTTTTPVKPQAATPLIFNTSKPVSSPIRTFASNHSPSPPVVPSNNTFNYKYRTNSSSSSEPDSPEPGSDETDKVNGNIPPPSPSSSPPPLDNLNEWNKKNSFDIRRKSLTSTTTSVEKTTTTTMSNKVTSVDHGSEVIEPSPVIIRTELDNVRSTKKSNNLNLKNNGTASTISASNNGGQVRSSYWTNQALQNDNAQKISESLKLDLDFKDEKISSLNKELEDLHTGGASEEEVATLKRQKHELEMRLKEEEEEIDDLAGQVQLLEQSKIKLEMSMAAMKKEHRRDIALKEEELEDARAATQKKVKALEQQLENEHEERINFVREKHELETKIINLQEMASRSADEEQVSKLKKDLKRTKALLKDAQLMIERSKSDSSNKVVMRQLKNQLEDSEFAKTAAIKAKQNLELELSDVQQQLDDVLRSKSDLEDKVLRLSREKADLSGQLDDSEEELQEVMKKYKASVSQLSVDQITIHEQANRIADIEEERNKLKEQIAELTSRIESLEGENIVNAHQNRLELKIKELESKLELEQTTRSRMETQINRLKEGIEKINSECDMLRNKELASQDMARKLQRQLRDLREDYATAQQKETEVNSKKNELEKQLELAEAETVLAKNDLKLAMKRIEDLQTAINVELDSESDSLNSDADSDSSEEGMEDFLEHHRRAVSVQRERESVAREAEARASIQREVRASIARESVARTLETMSEEPEFKL